MVLVSFDKEFVFLKTRKTAGTTVEMCLEPAYAPSRGPVKEKTKSRVTKQGIVGSRLSGLRHPKWLFRNSNRWRNHMPAEEVREAIGDDRFDRYTKITSVRNPFDRCVSLFHYRNPDLVRGGADFAEIHAAFRDFILQVNWPGDVETTHVRGRFCVDRVIRFESLAEDIRAVAAEMGVQLQEGAVPHTKSTASARKAHATADYYDRETTEKVKSKMAWVFDHYGYPVTPEEAKVAG